MATIIYLATYLIMHSFFHTVVAEPQKAVYYCAGETVPDYILMVGKGSAVFLEDVIVTFDNNKVTVAPAYPIPPAAGEHIKMNGDAILTGIIVVKPENGNADGRGNIFYAEPLPNINVPKKPCSAPVS